MSMNVNADIRKAKHNAEKTPELNPKFPYKMEKIKWYLTYMWMVGIIDENEFYRIYKRLPERYR